MRDTYSLYEAKARLSALVRRVREGHRVVITVHGVPAVELRPIEASEQSLEDRLTDIEARGHLIPAARAPSDPDVFRTGKANRVRSSGPPSSAATASIRTRCGPARSR